MSAAPNGFGETAEITTRTYVVIIQGELLVSFDPFC